MCIDVLGKYGRVRILKTKSAAAVRDAFATMITDVKPTFVQSDKGTEFLNATFQKLLSDNGIKHYTSENDDLKCAVVERWNRTILERLFRYLTYKNTTRYIDIMQDIVESYNRTFHSSIKTYSLLMLRSKTKRKFGKGYIHRSLKPSSIDLTSVIRFESAVLDELSRRAITVLGRRRCLK